MAKKTSRSQRITLSLPVSLIDQLRARTDRGNMSQYVAESISKRLEFERKFQLRKELIEGYRVRSRLHKELASDFFASEEEAFETFLLNDKNQREG